MKIVFVSNYINHHQIPFCNAMYAKSGGDFTFVQMEPMEEERIRMGWNPDAVPAYVKYAYRETEVCGKLILESDIVIWGGAEDETFLKPRLNSGRPTIRYSERLYKTGQWKAISPRGLKKKYYDHTRYRKKQVYLLCAGAFVASDFQIIRAYPDKKFKWGYFPECKKYDIDRLMEKKQREDGKKKILWAARFIDWKYPEIAVELAELLAKERSDFHISMIGSGEMQEEISNLIKQKQLEDYVTLTGSKTPEEVRSAMEQADIFLMTSDRREGWGAVMNEAMNSGCAVVANFQEGAAPYLIEHGKNGFLYRKTDAQAVLKYVRQLLDSENMCRTMGTAAYRTIAEEWNAETAADRLYQMCEDITAGQPPRMRWKSGPCSTAEVIKEK